VGGLSAYAASRDGRRRLTLGRNGMGTLTDRNLRETQVELDVPEVNYACFSPDGRLVAVASEFGFVGLWTTEDLRPGRRFPPIAKLEGFTLSPRSVAFSPDGTRLVAGGESVEAIRIFDVDTRQEVLTLTGSGQNCWDTQFSPDGNVLASNNGTGELNLWRAPTWEEIRGAEANERGGETKR
jgi:WD40 repeat protein